MVGWRAVEKCDHYLLKFHRDDMNNPIEASFFCKRSKPMVMEQQYLVHRYNDDNPEHYRDKDGLRQKWKRVWGI